MHEYDLILPADFDDYEWEVTAKGCFSEAFVTEGDKRYRLNFYDAVRLQQEVESAMQSGVMFFEPNLLVIKTVSKAEIKKAVESLMRSGQADFLLPE